MPGSCLTACLQHYFIERSSAGEAGLPAAHLPHLYAPLTLPCSKGGSGGWRDDERRQRLLAMLEEGGEDEDVDWDALAIKVGLLILLRNNWSVLCYRVAVLVMLAQGGRKKMWTGMRWQSRCVLYLHGLACSCTGKSMTRALANCLLRRACAMIWRRTVFIAFRCANMLCVLVYSQGTCQELEKSYFRLTSAPDPATVRWVLGRGTELNSCRLLTSTPAAIKCRMPFRWLGSLAEPTFSAVGCGR